MKHTKEPWSFSEGVGMLKGPDGKYIVGTTENNRRIVACVNACEGIPTADLEMDKPTFVAMLMQRQTLQLQNGELLAALKLVTDELEQLHNYYYRDCEGRNCPAGKYIELARSVMAMCSGGGTAPIDQCAECKSLSPTTAAMCRQCEKDTPAFTDLVNRMSGKGQ